MDTPDESPFRFSLLRLIVIVNLIGLGATPVVKAGTGWMLLVALLVSIAFVVAQTRARELADPYEPEREAAIWSLRFAFAALWFFGVYLYVSQGS